MTRWWLCVVCSAPSARTARPRNPMPALSALIDVARQLSEEEDTSNELYSIAGCVFLVLCFCFYCGCRKRVNACMGCAEDSVCGLGSEGDSSGWSSTCSICMVMAQDDDLHRQVKNEIDSRIPVRV